tara:strand:+ start:536 stop:1306 length:771 start_codon:yes stop_codon:yes gene_type:complete
MASPNKNMKEGGDYSQSFEGGVGGYAPYKMKGHELPGIKQRGMPYSVGDPLNEDMVDGISTSPDLAAPTKFLGGVFGGAAKNAMRSIGKAFGKNKNKKVPMHGDESHDGGGDGSEAAAVEQPATAADISQPSGAAAPDAPQTMMQNMLQGGVNQTNNPHLSGLAKDPKETTFAEKGRAAVGMFGSDIRLKEKIKKTGKSPSGIPIYEFNYIGGSNRYSGAMAQDLLEMNIDAVSLGEDGYYRVNYNNIDVDMRQIN